MGTFGAVHGLKLGAEFLGSRGKVAEVEGEAEFSDEFEGGEVLGG